MWYIKVFKFQQVWHFIPVRHYPYQGYPIEEHGKINTFSSGVTCGTYYSVNFNKFDILHQ